MRPPTSRSQLHHLCGNIEELLRGLDPDGSTMSIAVDDLQKGVLSYVQLGSQRASFALTCRARFNDCLEDWKTGAGVMLP